LKKNINNLTDSTLEKLSNLNPNHIILKQMNIKA